MEVSVQSLLLSGSNTLQRDRNAVGFFLDPSLPVILRQFDRVAISSQLAVNRLEEILVEIPPC